MGAMPGCRCHVTGSNQRAASCAMGNTRWRLTATDCEPNVVQSQEVATAGAGEVSRRPPPDAGEIKRAGPGEAQTTAAQ